MEKILITYAVEGEFVPIKIDGYELKYIRTGIGKAKSAMYLTQAILDYSPALVLNFGTAGTLHYSLGDILVCGKFIDRDFQSANLPGVEFEIDNIPSLEDNEIVKKILSSDIDLKICNTGDSFVTDAQPIGGDVVDMEAFAQALVCKEYNIPFLSVKYVTDIIGKNSIKHWEDKLSDARKGLEEWFR